MSTVKLTNINSLTASTPPVINDSAGTQIGTFCRAWVNFNGTGTVSTNQTIRASFNVTSVFKNGTGEYTVNFTTAMVDANYGFNISGGRGNSASLGVNIAPTTSSLRVELARSNAFLDDPYLSVSIFR